MNESSERFGEITSTVVWLFPVAEADSISGCMRFDKSIIKADLCTKVAFWSSETWLESGALCGERQERTKRKTQAQKNDKTGRTKPVIRGVH
jgi:hypothetical protein